MRRCSIGGLILLALAGSAFAADPIVILRDDGYYLLNPASTTLVKVQYFDQRTGTTPQPPGPGPGPGPTPVDVTGRIETAARAVNDKNAAVVIAPLLKVLADAKLPPANYQGSDNKLKVFFDELLKKLELFNPGVTARWKPFRETLTAILSELTSKGELQTAEQWQTVLNQVSAGIAKAGGQEAQIATEWVEMAIAEHNSSGAWPAAADGSWWQQILNLLLPWLMELLMRWITGT